MTIVIEKLSTKRNMGHLIFGEVVAKTYASAILLREFYQQRDIEYVRATDWRYYFIVRRYFLRKQRRANNGVWICHYCHKTMTEIQPRKGRDNSRTAVTVDHKHAVGTGGDRLDSKNMVECCYECNQNKGNQSYESYIKNCNLLPVVIV